MHILRICLPHCGCFAQSSLEITFSRLSLGGSYTAGGVGVTYEIGSGLGWRLGGMSWVNHWLNVVNLSVLNSYDVNLLSVPWIWLLGAVRLPPRSPRRKRRVGVDVVPDQAGKLLVVVAPIHQRPA